MKVKTADLIDAVLDYATLFAQGATETDLAPLVQDVVEDPGRRILKNSPSTDWSRGGPIIERECMDILCLAGGDDGWQADKYLHTEQVIRFGPTPLVAACRCLVASRLGDEVDIPEELLK